MPQERPSGTVIFKILQKEIYNSVDSVWEGSVSGNVGSNICFPIGP